MLDMCRMATGKLTPMAQWLCFVYCVYVCDCVVYARARPLLHCYMPCITVRPIAVLVPVEIRHVGPMCQSGSLAVQL